MKREEEQEHLKRGDFRINRNESKGNRKSKITVSERKEKSKVRRECDVGEIK